MLFIFVLVWVLVIVIFVDSLLLDFFKDLIWLMYMYKWLFKCWSFFFFWSWVILVGEVVLSFFEDVGVWGEVVVVDILESKLNLK